MYSRPWSSLQPSSCPASLCFFMGAVYESRIHSQKALNTTRTQTRRNTHTQTFGAGEPQATGYSHFHQGSPPLGCGSFQQICKSCLLACAIGGVDYCLMILIGPQLCMCVCVCVCVCVSKIHFLTWWCNGFEDLLGGNHIHYISNCNVCYNSNSSNVVIVTPW